MSSRPKPEVAEMWINPHSTLSRGYATWDRRQADTMNARYLDLAEIALRAEVAKPQASLTKANLKKRQLAAILPASQSKTKS